jgi:hypothetical protein
METLQNLFDTIISTQSFVLSTDQKISIFHQVNREFFGWVSPIHFIPKATIDTLTIELHKGTKIENDELSLGIGSFTIICTKPYYEQVTIRVKPISDVFKLGLEYHADYQLICEYFLEKAMRDNLQILTGAGVDMIERENITIQELRELLENRYGATLPVIVGLDASIDEC